MVERVYEPTASEKLCQRMVQNSLTAFPDEWAQVQQEYGELTQDEDDEEYSEDALFNVGFSWAYELHERYTLGTSDELFDAAHLPAVLAMRAEIALLPKDELDEDYDGNLGLSFVDFIGFVEAEIQENDTDNE